jgi:hypothetical protein
LLANRGMNPSSMLLIASLMHAVKAKPATSAAYGERRRERVVGAIMRSVYESKR